MKYLCLGYYDESKFNALPKEELDAIVAKCRPFDEVLRKSGHLVLVGSLAAPADSKSIRPKGGKPVVTDGPYSEAKEQIGAFFLIEANDADEALRIASSHPAANLGEQIGWGVELRPIDYFDQA